MPRLLLRVLLGGLLMVLGTRIAAGLRVGVQSPPGSTALAMYGPTFAYIQNETGIELDVVPFAADNDLQNAAVNQSIQLTFSTATPTYCIILPTNLQPIATVANIVNGQVTSGLAGDIVVLQDSAIQVFSDLRGRIVGVGQLGSLTLTQGPWGLLAVNNFSLFGDTAAVAFLGNGPAILAALDAGTIDVGFLPANYGDLYNVSFGAYRILGSQQSNDYPYPSSTPVFSSSVLGTLPSVNSSTRNRLTKALFDLSPTDPPVVQGKYYGWGTPQSFLTIRKLLQSTGLLPAGAEGCAPLDQIYDSIPCPAGFMRESVLTILQNCRARNVQCPANATCVCSPCRRVPVPHRIIGLYVGQFVAVLVVVFVVVGLFLFVAMRRAGLKVKGIIPWEELEIDGSQVLGQASLGLVLKGRYQGSPVAVKRAYPRLAEGRSIFDFADLEFERQLMVGEQRVEGIWVKRFARVSQNALECFGVRTARRRQMMEVAARTLPSRRHSNVVPTLGVCLGQDGAEVLTVNLFMERGSLHDLIGNPSVTIDSILMTSIARDVAAAMLWFHSRAPPLIGANLHPSHVLLDSNFRAHIGTSLVRGLAPSVFTAPELLDGKPANKGSDVYAYGMLLYMLVFRREPFDGEDPMAVFRAVRDSQGFTQKRPDVETAHPIVRELLEDCWESDPEKRPLFPQICAQLASVGRRSLADDLLLKVRKGQTLLEQVYPPDVARALEEGRMPPPKKYDMVTIFFSDIVGFTRISSDIGADEVMKMLHMVYSSMDRIADKHEVYKVETIGDAVSTAPESTKSDAS